jgi:hypothetical protein
MPEQLRKSIERLYHCKATHTQSAIVCEVFHGKTVWDGTVEVFELSGHSQAQRCFAWKRWEDGEGDHERIVMVLGIPPVDSPIAAVKAAIVTNLRRIKAN